MREPILAVTLDIEADHGWSRPYRFDALDRTAPLQALLDRHGVPLTAFATGEALERDSPLWAWLEAGPHQVGLHSYAHPRPGAPWDPVDLARARAAFRARFGRDATCWRPPYGRLDPRSLPDLRQAGLTRLSSYRARGGLLASPDGGMPLLDLPVSRALGLPLSLATLQVLGPALLRAAPPRAVLCLHLHDVIPTAARALLPLPLRLAYLPARRHGDPLAFLDALLSDLAASGTRFAPLFSPGAP